MKIKQGENDFVTVPHSCAEMDKQMPQFLGVTKAVVENVILCHQEEAMWPFADNLTLKSVFDDLFDTAKIAKLAELIRQAIKSKKKELRDKQVECELSRKNYEQHLSNIQELK